MESKLPMCTTVSLLLLLLLSLADTAKGRVQSPPIVNGMIDKLEAGTAAAKIAGLKAKAAAAVSRAQAAAAEAKTSEIHVEQLKMQNEMKASELNEALLQAKEADDEAVEAAKESAAALAAVKTAAKTAVDEAKKLAVDEVRKALTDKYHALEEWRTKVLDDPYDRARKAGTKAVVPYTAMIKSYYKRLGQYQIAAKGMMSKANKLASAAQDLAGGAQGRLDGGDPVGANQDIMTANAMRKQSAQLAGAAESLQAEAQQMNKWIAEYTAAGHMAAWRAEYEADPDQLPPPPVNPNNAFTPPPQ